jgi:hypothetical protein
MREVRLEKKTKTKLGTELREEDKKWIEKWLTPRSFSRLAFFFFFTL